MVQTIKVSPAERTDSNSNGQFPRQASSMEDQEENVGEKIKMETTNKTKQYILIALVIFNTFTCVSLIIVLPIVLKDSDNENINSTPAPTTIPDFTTPTRTENSVLVLSTYNDAQPFVLDFNGMAVIKIYLIFFIFQKAIRIFDLISSMMKTP